MARSLAFRFASLCAAVIIALGLVASPDLAMAKKPATKLLKLMIYGDNGIVGLAMADEALRRGHTVTLVVDKPEEITKRHKKFTVLNGNITDLHDVGQKIAAEDIVIVATRSDDASFVTSAANSMVTASRVVGAWAPRIIWIGYASALEDESGKRLIATMPSASRVGCPLGQTEALTYFQTVTDVLWTYLTPPLEIKSGKRTRKFRIGDGHVLRDAKGNSTISAEDLAVAAINEAEKPKHTHAQFNVAY
ncbi:MAG: hypothetical protein EPO08_12220 [Rhodospirillaceae bacterium]|nr:MAG: hypothetical protein EPO08_12220 [Rhodospirillaceae bacterium]